MENIGIGGNDLTEGFYGIKQGGGGLSQQNGICIKRLRRSRSRRLKKGKERKVEAGRKGFF